MMMFSPIDILIMLVGGALAGWAQWRVKSAYAKYSQVGVRSGVTGAQVAQRMMQAEGIDDVSMEMVQGQMTDHYDPKNKVVRLSHDVYHGQSISALGIAAHEVGHVIQDAQGYAPMHWRSAIYPVSSLGSSVGPILIMVGFFGTAFTGTSLGWLITLGIWFFAASVAFTLITLPVEFDASRRALRALADGRTMTEEELAGTKKVLGAAAMTYVAAAAVAIMWLLRYMLLARSSD